MLQSCVSNAEPKQTPPFDAPIQLRVPKEQRSLQIVRSHCKHHIRYTVAEPHVAGHEDQSDQAVQFPSTANN